MKSLLIASLLAIAAPAATQITLNQAAYGTWRPQTETAFRLDSNSSDPVLTPAANASWNLTNVVYDPNNVRTYHEGTFSDPAFPAATFYDTLIYPVGPALSYGVEEAGVLNTSGFQYLGQKIRHQAFSLAAMTGGSNDSMVFPAQISAYTSPRTAVGFPATLGSSWSSHYQFTTSFNLTVAAYGLNNTPCQRKTRIAYTNQVVGWGKMQVKDSNGSPSVPMNVLMVKTVMLQADSFFMAGSPASAQLLSAFGLSQGFQTNRFYYDFFRAGERMALLSALYRDSSFSASNVERMDVHVNHLVPQGIANVNIRNGVQAYPNPVQAQTVNLEIAGHDGSALHYVLINMAGQTVGKGTLIPVAGAARLQAEALATPGIYYLQFTAGGALVTSIPLSVE